MSERDDEVERETRLGMQNDSARAEGAGELAAVHQVVVQVPSVARVEDSATTSIAGRPRLRDHREARQKRAARTPDRDWESRLVMKDAKEGPVPSSTIANATTILKNHPDWHGVIAWDEFTQQIVFLRPPPWNVDDAGTLATEEKVLTDAGCTRLASWLLRCEHRINLAERAAYSAARLVAEGNAFDSLQDYLDGLTWDGVPRLDRWISMYLGAKDTAFARFAGKAFLVSAVARGYVPGEKVDHTLILEGKQDRGKSSALAALFGDYYSETPLELSSKDRFVNLRGVWGQSFDELASLSRSEDNTVKNFLTSRHDVFRPPYGAHPVKVSRRVVFCGTVNPQEGVGYLKDPTGNRRYWPVMCAVMGPMLYAELARDRDQLWAEAIQAYQAGLCWWPVSDAEKALCRAEQEQREQGNPWDELVGPWLAGERQKCPKCSGNAGPNCGVCAGVGTVEGRDAAKPYVTQSEILDQVLGIPKERWAANSSKLAAVLASLGWKAGARRVKRNGVQFTAYYPAAAPQPDENEQA
jgi:putative DNA primase/helicase